MSVLLQAFGEVYDRADTTRFSIVHVDLLSAVPKVILNGRSQTQWYFLLNQAVLYQNAFRGLKSILNKMSNRIAPELSPSLRFGSTQRGMPTVPQTSAYSAGLLFLLGKKVLRRVHKADVRWNVAFVREGWRDAVFSTASVIRNPESRYYADPFVLSRDGKDFCFVEDYDISAKKGSISVLSLEKANCIFLGTALCESFHLSFPFLFETEAGLYMCPESSQNSDIRVYKCVEFPLRWELAEIIMRNVSAADSMLFERNGKWWLFTNIATGGDHCTELSIFSSNSPTSVEWKPHSQNPVIMDASRARNGGLIRDGNRIFRVAQGQGFDFYGKRASVNEIVDLDDHKFIEETVCIVEPAFREGALGTHHLHSNGKITVFDFADRAFW